MSSQADEKNLDASRAQQFATTHWSLVLAAGQEESPDSRQALGELCAIYWYPLYAYLRRRGYRTENAEDLTQAFFARILEKQDLRIADQQRGKFRSFLLAALKHFLANQRDYARARKRGGAVAQFPIHFDGAEERYIHEPSDELTPEKIFDRRWALMLLEQVLARLRQEYVARGKTDLFELLKSHLTGQEEQASYAQIAVDLEMTEAAVKVAAYRLRTRYRELFRQEIAQTVESPQEIDLEIQDLFIALET